MGASDYAVGDPGRYAAPLVGFQLGQSLADLPNAYMQGREQKRVSAMQDMFSGGLPRNEDGSTNWTAALQKYLQEGAKVGGGSFVGQYVPQLLDEEQARNASAISRGQPVGPSAFFGPAPGQANTPSGSGNLAMGGGQPALPAMRPQQASSQPQQPQSSAGTDNAGDQTFLANVATKVFGERDVSPLIGRYAKALGIEPSDPLTPAQEQQAEKWMRNSAASLGNTRVASSEVNQPAEATSAADDGMNVGGRPPFMGSGLPRIPAMGGGAPSGAPAPATGAAPNAVAQAGGGMANVDAAGSTAGGLRPTPVGTEAEARLKERSAVNKEAAAAYLSKRNPTGSKDLMEQAQADRKRASEIRASLGEYNKPTGEMMNAQAGGFKNPIDAKAAAKFAEDVAGAKGKRVADAIGSIKPARDALNVINEMDNALTSGWNNIATGPGARQWLEVKKAVNNVYPGTFSNVTQAETIDKLNAQLAAAAAKAMTARPSQLEFRAFMSNNPGLLTSRETSRNLLDIMRQGKQQELDLGQIAGKLRPGQDYADAEEQYYRSHPIISPFTHKPIDAKKAADGKWYRPDPDRPGKYLAER